jgi:serine/threonine protein phosphatase 1
MLSSLFRSIRRTPAPAPPTVPSGSRVYAIGDIHGRADLLALLHAAILEDVAQAETTPNKLVAVYVGDYVDRGLHSREVIDLLLREPLPGFESVHLMGNHEDMMLGFLADAGAGPQWLANGGDATLVSYGVRDAATAAPAADGGADSDRMDGLRAGLAAALPADHLAFLRALRPSHAEGDYLFVHAGVRPGVPVARQRREDLLWIRDEFLDSAADHGAVVVHGHSIAYQPEVTANRIGIDTGAYVTGHLTALVLDGESQRFMST